MQYKIIIVSFGLLSLLNCNAQKSTMTDLSTKNMESNTKENIIYFKEGENKFLKEYEMNVTFKGISEDSRCPKDVNCIWAGVAIAQIEVMGLATRPVTISLATTNNDGKNYHNSSEFNGYSISLHEVTPYPSSQNPVKSLKGQYKIGITINKDENNPTTK
ncbi:hypothetical protein [Chryseobacterium fistulae]|uniref:Lipoprotein n=1 Tax=Chryseobacterium fistulae TaxID=2675058 RepID=A0A6N4XKL5_9FLAO|nr:hypothetical protein [Chryseobacterium fistulae]CAA7386297.1 hypothetical protein CHRY9393_00589 [Chryseobacterium fistulae]